MSFTYTIYGKEGDQYATSTSKLGGLPLGARMVMRDGRVYRHTLNGATALTAGQLLVQATAIANSTFIHVLYQDATQNSTSVVFNGTGGTGVFTANQLKDGVIWFSATGATGQGEAHLIYSHVAWSTVTGTTVTIHLYPNDKIRNAWDTSTGVARLLLNKYSGVIKGTTALGSGGAIAGVSNIAVAANSYFWAQTWGLCPVEYDNLATGTLLVGQAVVGSTETAGNIGNRVSSDSVTGEGRFCNPQIGVAASIAATTFQALIDLTIAP